jgi:hypothetical protein
MVTGFPASSLTILRVKRLAFFFLSLFSKPISLALFAQTLVFYLSQFINVNEINTKLCICIYSSWIFSVWLKNINYWKSEEGNTSSFIKYACLFRINFLRQDLIELFLIYYVILYSIFIVLLVCSLFSLVKAS